MPNRIMLIEDVLISAREFAVTSAKQMQSTPYSGSVADRSQATLSDECSSGSHTQVSTRHDRCVNVTQLPLVNPDGNLHTAVAGNGSAGHPVRRPGLHGMARPALALSLFLLVFSSVSLFLAGDATRVHAQEAPPPTLIQTEAEAVHLVNLKRRENGLPPLRWNQELTAAARWFAFDTVENRALPYCGHEDTQARQPGQRIQAFGYARMADWAENVICGYTSPTFAVNAWMRSPDHSIQLLDPRFRETGLGYYVGENGRGYIVQDFSVDSRFAPVIINDEALVTATADVRLYLYSPTPAAGFTGIGQVTEILVGNDLDFSDSVWQPYTSEVAWTLLPGDGWRTVYVKMRDVQGRTILATDDIYLGTEPPADGVIPTLSSSQALSFTIAGLEAAGRPLLQVRRNWLADDAGPYVEHLAGAGQQVSDPAAIGGTAFQLSGAAGEGALRMWTTELVKGIPLHAYVRMKAAGPAAPGPIARVEIKAGGVEFDPLIIDSADLAGGGSYQEFMLPFTFEDNVQDPLLYVRVFATGATPILFDAVRFYTAPFPVNAGLPWDLATAQERQDIPVGRFVDATGTPSDEFELLQTVTAFTEPEEPSLAVTPESLNFVWDTQGVSAGSKQVLEVTCQACSAWTVESDVAWLTWEFDGDSLSVEAAPDSLAPGDYEGAITIRAPEGESMAPVRVPVTLTVAATEEDPGADPAPNLIETLFLPVSLR